MDHVFPMLDLIVVIRRVIEGNDVASPISQSASTTSRSQTQTQAAEPSQAQQPAGSTLQTTTNASGHTVTILVSDSSTSSTSTAMSKANSDSPRSSSTNHSAVIGGVVGGVLGAIISAAILTCCVLLYLRRRRAVREQRLVDAERRPQPFVGTHIIDDTPVHSLNSTSPATMQSAAVPASVGRKSAPVYIPGSESQGTTTTSTTMSSTSAPNSPGGQPDRFVMGEGRASESIPSLVDICARPVSQIIGSTIAVQQDTSLTSGSARMPHLLDVADSDDLDSQPPSYQPPPPRYMPPAVKH
jgi:hypothetical protein